MSSTKVRLNDVSLVERIKDLSEEVWMLDSQKADIENDIERLADQIHHIEEEKHEIENELEILENEARKRGLRA